MIIKYMTGVHMSSRLYEVYVYCPPPLVVVSLVPLVGVPFIGVPFAGVPFVGVPLLGAPLVGVPLVVLVGVDTCISNSVSCSTPHVPTLPRTSLAKILTLGLQQSEE